MPINIICSKCATAYAVDDEYAGHVITCAKCRANMQVPALVAAGPMSLNPRLVRVLGREPPLLFDILGLHARWSGEESGRDVVLLIWSLRHIALLVLVGVLYAVYSENRETATSGAALLFWAGAIVFVISWIQMGRISGTLNKNIAGRDASALISRIVAALLLVVTDFRCALPALRTLVLSALLVFAGLRLTDISGSWSNLAPIGSFRAYRPASTHPYRPAFVAPTPTTEASPPPTPPTITKAPSSPDEGPLPPPKDE